MYGVVQEFRAELAALGQEVRQLAELNKAAAKRRTAGAFRMTLADLMSI